jgi:hypothetical protein
MIVCALCDRVIVDSSEKRQMIAVQQLAFQIGAGTGVQLLLHIFLMTRVEKSVELATIPRKSHRVKRQRKFITDESERVA